MSTHESRRLYFLDNLRAALAIMIVTQHAAFPYAPGAWWHVESRHHTQWLGPFMTVYSAYIMPLFFLISGYFHPGAFDRKGSATFLGDRFRRLGIPMGVFFLAVNPIILYAYFIYLVHPTKAYFVSWRAMILSLKNSESRKP